MLSYCNDCPNQTSIPFDNAFRGSILLKKSLIAISLLLTIAFITACGPSNEPKVSLADIAQAAARQDDRASVEELAGWIVEGRGDFKLIDVRMPDDFDSGSIGDAENIPIAQIASQDVLARLPTDRVLIVYSNGSENAAKATVMLRLAGFDAHLLAGGYNAWHARILNPDIPADEVDGESLQVSEQRALSCYFVGERSDLADKRKRQESAPFVPPVYLEEEELEEDVPLGVGEESC